MLGPEAEWAARDNYMQLGGGAYIMLASDWLLHQFHHNAFYYHKYKMGLASCANKKDLQHADPVRLVS